MTVRERVERRTEFRSRKFVVADPEFGQIAATVDEFIGIENGKPVLKNDHPAINFEVVREEL